VTISGLFDQITSMGRNTYDGNLTRTATVSGTGAPVPSGLRVLGRRVRAVLGLEIDLAIRAMARTTAASRPTNSGSAGGAATVPDSPATQVNTTVALTSTRTSRHDRDQVDLHGVPLTVRTVSSPSSRSRRWRGGRSAVRYARQYKLAAIRNGDFAGVSAVTTSRRTSDQPRSSSSRTNSAGATAVCPR